MRNSVLKIQRKTNGGKLLKNFKRSTTIISPKESSHKSKVLELTLSEQMIIYFVANLFLFREYETAQKVIHDYGLGISKNPLYLGNLHKLLALTLNGEHHRLSDNALEHMEKALSYFEAAGTVYG